MDKKTLIRLATPASIFALAISIATLPLTVKAYGEKVEIDGSVWIKGLYPIEVEVNSMPRSY
jgi:hypothetical protein